jgi:hypothetical protein
MFARVKSTVSQLTNKIGFGAGWVAGYTVATGKKVTEKTSEAVQVTTALAVRTVNQAASATAKATKTASEKVTSTAKSAWQAVGKTARSAHKTVVWAWHNVGSFCLRHLDKATWAMVIGVVLLLAVSQPASALLVGAVLYNAGLLCALVGMIYLAYLVTHASWEYDPAPSVA